jgi:hypothetical protein
MINQAAPLSARTNHVKPGGDLNNSNSIGVALEGDEFGRDTAADRDGDEAHEGAAKAVWGEPG